MDEIDEDGSGTVDFDGEDEEEDGGSKGEEGGEAGQGGVPGRRSEGGWDVLWNE